MNGTKRYITNAPRAGIFTLLARTGTREDGARGITAFIVDAKSPGITLGKPDKKMGQQGAQTCDVVFEDCRVPVDNVIGGADRIGQGFKTAMKVLDRGRLHISALAVARRTARSTTALPMPWSARSSASRSPRSS